MRARPALLRLLGLFALAAALASAAGLMTSCGDMSPESFDDQKVFVTGGWSGTGASPRYVYTANRASDSISIFSVNSGTGELQNLGAAVTGTKPLSVTMVLLTDASTLIAYAVNQGSNNVSIYNVGANGLLTEFTGGNSPVAAGTGPAGISAITISTRQFAYVSNVNASTGGGQDTISQYEINQTAGGVCAGPAGKLCPIGTAVNAGTTPFPVVITPSAIGASFYAYAVNWSSGNIYVYRIESTGALTQLGSPVAAGSQPSLPRIATVGGKFRLYVPLFGSDQVRVFTLNDAGGSEGLILDNVVGSPFTVGNGPMSVAVTSVGGTQRAYVANWLDDNIRIYALAGDGGLGTQLTNSPKVAGDGPHPITVSENAGAGQFLYTANTNSNTISAYSFDTGAGCNGEAGSLCAAGLGSWTTQGTPVSFAGTRGAAAVSYTANLLYIADSSNGFARFTVAGTGVLSGGANQALAGCTSAFWAGVNPAQTFVYVPCILSDVVVGLNIPAGFPNQALTTITGSPFSAAGAPAQRHGGANDMDNPWGTAVDLTGRYLYVANDFSDDVTGFSIASNGALTELGSWWHPDLGSPCPGAGAVVAMDGCTSLAMHPSGKYVVVACDLSFTVASFEIGSNGALTWKDTECGGSADQVIFHPSGKYVYVANGVDDTITQYTFNTDGTLTPFGSPQAVVAFDRPEGIAIEPTGKYAFSAHANNNVVERFQVQDGTIGGCVQPVGGLCTLGTTATGSGPRGVVVDISGRYLYTANNVGATIGQYSINLGNGNLTSLGADIGYQGGTGERPKGLVTVGTIQ